MTILENMKHSMTNSKYIEQNTKKTSNRNLNSPTLQSAPVFILCEICYWCASYLDTNRLLKEEGVDDDNSIICPQCNAIDYLSSLPILSNCYTYTDR
jgi:hypothetical protein